ncbi:Histone acetyltransferase mst2 [Neonectria ditissima]|uniref:Histone acetyltransferase n=1 Tax=Neonectria ditissima TaxID=78410 RepID=A0A0P7BQX6_9HYPO|nr:Histone acetyltransferase mst2 [Neonectria ditissima]
MSSAHAMEEESQQSAMLSDQDAEYDTVDTAGEASTVNAPGSKNPRMGASANNLVGEDDDVDFSDRDASGEELGEELDEDAEGEDDNDFILQQGPTFDDHKPHENVDDEEDGDVDAEGEEYEQDEGVGAVKFKPGETDNEEEESESDGSDLPSALEESDEDAPWEDVRGVEEDEDSEEPEDEEMPDQDMDDDVQLTSQQSGISDLPEELLATQSGVEGSVSSSAINENAKNDESMDGSHTLRKRKSSSLESEDHAASLRKRRRDQSTEPHSSNEDAMDNENTTEGTRQHPSRARLKATRPSLVSIEKRTRNSLVLKIQVRPGNLKEILSRRKRDRRRPPGSVARPTPSRPSAVGTPKINPIPPPSASAVAAAATTSAATAAAAAAAATAATVATIANLPTPFTSDTYSQPFYSFIDRETEDMKGKPYGGILTEAEADTSKTLPVPEDRRKFDEAKQKAEDEWRARVFAMRAEADVPLRRHKKTNENASQIECIEFGGWEIDTWYAAPYPAEYSRNRVLYICEFCLKYMNSDYVAWRHKLKCPAKHPPGDEIYRHGSVSVFEVDGRKNPVYCQNLCLLAKLFLGSKTLYYDVEPFLFYVLCEYDDCGYHFVGYFSKEKRASSQNNVSCILTLPIHQRKGYGNLLIDFSYLLTKVEQKTGSPEKPLSDMGLVSYRNYWRLVLCRYFLDAMDEGEYKKHGLSIKRISDGTGMTPDDVIAALEGLRALVRDPETKLYAFRVDVDYCRQYVAKWESKGHVRLKPEALAWTPYVMGRSNVANFELGPPINTIAPREDDEAKVDEGLETTGLESQPTVNGDNKSVSEQGTEVPLESTEAEEEAGSEPVTSIEKVALEDQESTSPKDEEMHDVEDESAEPWALPYRGIPPIRFEVFPTIAGSRRADRSRQSFSRPSGPRTSSGGSRSRRAGGGSHRPTPSRPRTSSKSASRNSSKNSSRRKSGGTGRGPGRWPKGTKKADYGNADSGPGLPPGWSASSKAPLLQPITEGKDPEKVEGAVEGTGVDPVVLDNAINGEPVKTDGVDRDASGAETDREDPAPVEEEEEEDVDAEGEDV